MQELFCDTISGVIIRDPSCALCACHHNLLMVLRATPISSVTMVSEPHGNTPSLDRLNNKHYALFCCSNNISLYLGAIPIQPCVKLKQQSTRILSTGKNKMGGQCVVTSTEIMTPKTFLQTFKIYNEMYILSYTNQQYRFG